MNENKESVEQDLIIMTVCLFVFMLVIFKFASNTFLVEMKEEIQRSKGMLSMIPDEYLERDGNLMKLTRNHMIHD